MSFNARHYDPQIGRFISADTVVDGVTTTAGWNRYMYVHGNPVMYKDPTGHFMLGGSEGFFAGLAKVFGLGGSEGSGSGAPVKVENSAVVQKTAESNLQSAKTSTGAITNKDKAPDFGSPLATLTSAEQLKKPQQGGIMTSGTGTRTINGVDEYHPGVDLYADEGTKVQAAAKGKAIYFPPEIDGKPTGYGNLTVIEHENGYSTYYAHQNEGDWKAGKLENDGKFIDKGTTIGGVGHTGRSIGLGDNPGDHLHFEVRRYGVANQDSEAMLRDGMKKEQ